MDKSRQSGRIIERPAYYDIPPVGGKAIRQAILERANHIEELGRSRFLGVNREGGVGLDRHLKRLIKEGLLTIHRPNYEPEDPMWLKMGLRSGAPIRWTHVELTDAGRKMLTGQPWTVYAPGPKKV